MMGSPEEFVDRAVRHFVEEGYGIWERGVRFVDAVRYPIDGGVQFREWPAAPWADMFDGDHWVSIKWVGGLVVNDTTNPDRPVRIPNEEVLNQPEGDRQ